MVEQFCEHYYGSVSGVALDLIKPLRNPAVICRIQWYSEADCVKDI